MKIKKPTILISLGFEFIKKRNEHREYIDSELVKFVSSCGYNIFLVSNILSEKPFSKNKDFINDIIKKLNVVGIILSGGANIGLYKNRDKTEFYLLKQSIKKKIPLLGICRGLQLVNFYFKGTFNKISNHVRKKNIIKIDNKKFNIICYHKNSIKKLGKDLEITSLSSKGCIEAIKHNKYPIYGWMWHPERNLKYKRYFQQKIKKIFIK